MCGIMTRSQSRAMTEPKQMEVTAKDFSEMPFEVTSHIMSYLPLKSVFVCMSVCKEWKYVATDRIAHCKRVRVFQNFLQVEDQTPHLYDIRTPFDNDSILLLILNSLLSTQRLEQFVFYVSINDPAMKQACKQLVDIIACNNCSTLKTMHTFVDPMTTGTVFPRLQEFGGFSLLYFGSETMPRLKRLTVCQMSHQLLNHLSADQMESLCLTYGMQVEEVQFPDFVTIVTRFQNLSVFNLCVAGALFFTGDDILRLFTSFPRMQEFRFDLMFRHIMDMDLDDAIDGLVNKSPLLRSVAVNGGFFSDLSLQSLSRLQYLQVMEFWPIRTSCSTAGYLTLLRGPSRHRLQTISVRNNDDLTFTYAISEELKAIARETGKSWEKETELDTDYAAGMDGTTSSTHLSIKLY